MIIEIRTDSLIPPYDQIRTQVETMAASGVLPAGHQLPSIRQLAADLGLAPGTVARAYRELETAGVVVTHAGRGTTISADKPRLSERERRARLISAARDYLTATQRLGVDTDQAIAALHKLLA
jgi:DNA-binding transcriptional regulator YhcF (GntR family)